MSTSQYCPGESSTAGSRRRKKTVSRALEMRHRELRLQGRRRLQRTLQANLGQQESPIWIESSDSDPEEEYVPSLPSDSELVPSFRPFPKCHSDDSDIEDHPIIPHIPDPILVARNAHFLPQQEELGSFIVTVHLEGKEAGLALVDSGASVNLFPKSLVDRLGFFTAMNQPMHFKLASGTEDAYVGVMKSMTIQIGRLYFLIDVVIMEMREDPACPILLGRSFLTTARCNLNWERGEMILYDALGVEVHHVVRPAIPRNLPPLPTPGVQLHQRRMRSRVVKRKSTTVVVDLDC